MTKKQLSNEQVVEILIKLERGALVKDLATEYSVRRTTIQRRVKVYRTEQRLGRKKSKRSRKITPRQLSQLKSLIRRDPFATITELKRELGLSMHRSTISKYCAHLGIRRLVSPKKFNISLEHSEERFNYAMLRANWTAFDWEKIVFCDESGLDNSGFYRRLVWRPRGMRFAQQFIYRAPNMTLRINYFSYVSSIGVGKLFVYKRMDSPTYCQIVSKMICELREKFEHDDFKIVHDNAAFSQSEYTRRYLEENDLRKYFVHIPPYSPDMNIVENLWALLKRKVRERCFLFGQTRGRRWFIELLQREWSSIPLSVIDNLYLSLPARMRAIVEADGVTTRF